MLKPAEPSSPDLKAGVKGDEVGVHPLKGALHDVSNALTVILGWVAEAREESERTPHALAIIEKRARAARDLARRAIGAHITVMEETDSVDEAISETVDAHGIEAKQVGVKLELDLRAGDAPVLAASELSQVVGNLLLNAIAFTPPGGVVHVRSRLDAGAIRVEVEDEGAGIPADRASMLFSGGTTRKGGAGVGLAYARSVARANGGDLALTSGAPHACFQLSWPSSGLVSTRPVAPPPSASRPRLLGGISVLVLEDDADVVGLLDTALSARGADVTVTSNSKSFHAAKGAFDVVLLDISPIAEDLAGAVKSVRDRFPQAGIVFTSGTVSEGPEIYLAQGAKWVRKPFEVKELVDAVVSVSQPKT